MATIQSFGVPQLRGASQADSPIIMPKLGYRFRVTMFNFGGNQQSTLSSTFTSQVVSVSRPTVTHEEVTVDIYNSKIFLAGKHSWETLTLTLKDDIKGGVDKFIAAQLQRQLNHAAQSAAYSGGQYKFAMYIDTLDGGNTIAGGLEGTMPIVLDRWSLAGCWIVSANYGENNYSTSDVTQVQLQIRYDNADHSVIIGDGEGLEGALESQLSQAGNRDTNVKGTANAP